MVMNILVAKTVLHDARSLGKHIVRKIYTAKVQVLKRKELYQELEQAFIDELQPLCNKQGDTNYCQYVRYMVCS